MSGIPAWAFAGAKVVCIRDFSQAVATGDIRYNTKPALNAVYHVAHAKDYGHAAAISLAEFEPDHYFDVRGFRPAISQADDLAAHFDQLLQVPHRIEEKA